MYISRTKVKYLNVIYMDFNNIHWNVISQDTFDWTNFPNYYRSRTCGSIDLPFDPSNSPSSTCLSFTCSTRG